MKGGMLLGIVKEHLSSGCYHKLIHFDAHGRTSTILKKLMGRLLEVNEAKNACKT
jgi:hypothetical protein